MHSAISMARVVRRSHFPSPSGSSNVKNNKSESTFRNEVPFPKIPPFSSGNLGHKASSRDLSEASEKEVQRAPKWVTCKRALEPILSN